MGKDPNPPPTPEIVHCADCFFFEPDTVNLGPTPSGTCHRFPLGARKTAEDWCGEGEPAA